MYTHLLSPLHLGWITLPNRIIMGSMHTNLEEIPGGFDRAAQYYAERARGKVGLIITGGIAPDKNGCVAQGAAMLVSKEDVVQHRIITQAVHNEGGLICMQILHTGRYGYHPHIVAPSALQAPINFFKPKELDEEGIQETINNFVRCAKLAKEAGYDGIEIMGSEGYLINQFLAPRTNHRTDQWGGSFGNRRRFALEIINRTRAAVGKNFLIIFRLSLLDLVENGSSWDEVIDMAKAVELAGVDIINTGIGWHEARIPTIASVVPRGAFSWISGRLKKHIAIPIIAVNRINMPEVGEKIISAGDADLVSMARPFLADSEFVLKTMEGRSDEINTCIACNQACLDHTFQMKISSCLVNPRACHETELAYVLTQNPKKIAVVGGGPAGLAFAHVASMRGHIVTLFEASNTLGGQFNLAKNIPGKEDYAETIRYYQRMMQKYAVDVKLNTYATPSTLIASDFDTIILANGILSRVPQIAGIDHSSVIPYSDLLSGKVSAGDSVAIIGAGGIGFDVATYLSSEDTEMSLQAFLDHWGIDKNYSNRGAIQPPQPSVSPRKIYLLKRSSGKHGASLGKTTGWIHKSHLKMKNVEMLSDVVYENIDDNGLHIDIHGQKSCLAVDHIIICAGQEPNRQLYNALNLLHDDVHCIGGAYEAKELDAKAAIHQACTLAASI